MTNESGYPVTAMLNVNGDLQKNVLPTVVFEKANESDTLIYSGFACSLGANQTVTAKMSITPASSTGNFEEINLTGLTVNFEKTPKKSDLVAKGFSFTAIEDTQTVKVSGTSTIDKTVPTVIPSSYIDGSQVYLVSQIGGFSSGGSALCANQVTIPSSATEICASAFQYASSITSIYIPSSITTIGAGVFTRLTALTGLFIPGSVTTIPNLGFDATGGSSITIILQEGVKELSENAFRGCRQTLTFNLPQSLTTIGTRAFGYNYGNENITINYAGTSTQWLAITKANNWFECQINYPGTVTINCSDGVTLDKDGAVVQAE